MNQKLKQIAKVIDLDLNLDDFYVIRIYDNLIHLQGEHNETIQSHCEKIGYQFTTDGMFKVGTNHGIEITLVIQ